MAGKVKITLDLSERLSEQMEEARQKRGITKADFFRQSLGLLFAMEKAQQEGFNVGAYRHNPDGSTDQRVFLLPR